MKSSVEDCQLVQLTKIPDPRGNLTFIEGTRHVPFEVRRTYWIYDVPGGETRGGHAYKRLEEFVVALSGSFNVVVDDGRVKRTFMLNRSYLGLYIPNLIWREIENFSTNSVCLILASLPYSEEDYLRDYEAYLQTR